jgi:hypothetical protein
MLKLDLFEDTNNEFKGMLMNPKRFPSKPKFKVTLELPQGEKTPGQVAEGHRIH